MGLESYLLFYFFPSQLFAPCMGLESTPATAHVGSLVFAPYIGL